MRKIKFRAWDKIEKKMWIPIIDQEGFPCAKHPITCLLIRMDGELLDPIMQYTGLKDKNGKEIYEGDILNHCELGKGYKDFRVIEWKEIEDLEESYTGFNIYPSYAKKYLVVGNIYENPELLK